MLCAGLAFALRAPGQQTSNYNTGKSIIDSETPWLTFIRFAPSALTQRT